MGEDFPIQSERQRSDQRPAGQGPDPLKSDALGQGLGAIATSIRDLAEQHQGQSVELLALLRLLEALHREIRDGLFQQSLPDNRQALYSLLKDIEAGGGWPYIYRMKLQSFLANFDFEDPDIRPRE